MTTMRCSILAACVPQIELWFRGNRLLSVASLFFETTTAWVLIQSAVTGQLFPALGTGFGKAAVAVLGAAILGTRIGVLLTRSHAAYRRRTSYWGMVSAQFARNAKSAVGTFILLFLVLLTLYGPFVTPNPFWMDFSATLQAPSATHILGTDMFGRDILSRIVHGARVSLGIGTLATVLNILLGAMIGIVTGYFQGPLELLLMRPLEVLNSIPFLMLAILLMAVFGSGTGMLILILSVFALQPARIIRSRVLEIRTQDYITAAGAIGSGHWRILLRHLVPNTVSSLIVVGSIRIGQNILTLAGLSFLGLGIPPPTPSWGAMLQEGRSLILRAPWIGLFPGLAIFITVLAFNLIGDALRDALDPRLAR